MQSNHYRIVYANLKTLPNLTKNDTDFPNSVGTGTVPKMMGKKTETWY